jgi:hypothetical protein
MLYVTHIFSPYLNHPLGLGFLLFIVPFIDSRRSLLPIHLPASVTLSSTSNINSSIAAPVTKQNA